jgi:hypothetical protein
MLKNGIEDAVWINLSHDVVHWQCAANSNEIVGSIKQCNCVLAKEDPDQWNYMLGQARISTLSVIVSGSLPVP